MDGVHVPDWRFKEIQCIADSTVCRASYCLIGRLAARVEREYLPNNAHISFFVDPSLDIGVAEYDKVKSKNVISAGSKLKIYAIEICFNGNASSKADWVKTTRGLLKALGEIIFFSPISKLYYNIGKKIAEKDKKKYLEYFITQVISLQPFDHHATRPRFTLAKLKDIIETSSEMQQYKDYLTPHLQRILHQYLGPDASMRY